MSAHIDSSTTPASDPSDIYLPPADLHNHTIYCGHAEPDATVSNLLARARETGLELIGISEHVMQLSDAHCIESICTELRQLRPTNALFAVEMDIDPADPNGGWVTQSITCDYVILSAHGFPQFDLEIPASDRNLEPYLQRRNLAIKWLAWYSKAICRGGFQILGHPLREPLVMNIIDLTDDQLMEAIVRSFAPAIDQGIAFELNNAFLAALSISTQYDPYLAMAIRLRRMGMKFSRGSDSHGALKVGACEAIAGFAHDAGLTRDDWFDASQIQPTWR